MTKKERLAAAEQLVRTVLSRDLKQTKTPNTVVREVAKQVVKAIPTEQPKSKS